MILLFSLHLFLIKISSFTSQTNWGEIILAFDMCKHKEIDKIKDKSDFKGSQPHV